MKKMCWMFGLFLSALSLNGYAGICSLSSATEQGQNVSVTQCSQGTLTQETFEGPVNAEKTVIAGPVVVNGPFRGMGVNINSGSLTVTGTFVAYGLTIGAGSLMVHGPTRISHSTLQSVTVYGPLTVDNSQLQ